MKSNFIGAAIAVSASVGSNLGVNIQKKSHNLEEKREFPRPYHLRPLWWLGMFLVVFGGLGDSVALGFAPQMIVCSLGGGSTVIANVIFSHFWLKQPLYITDIIGVIFVTIGVVTLACASPNEGHYTINQIYSYMFSPQFILYGVLTSIFIWILLLRIQRSTAPRLEHDVTVEQEKGKSLSKSKAHVIAEEDAVSLSDNSKIIQSSDELSSDDTLESSADLSDHSDSEPSDKLKKQSSSFADTHLIIDSNLPLYWAAISGTIGAQSMLLAKCVMEMIMSTVNGDNQFYYIGTYIIIGGMVMCLMAQTHTQNIATMNGDTMSTFPVFQAFWISMSNINGVIFFQQAHEFTKLQWILFPTALGLVVLGITLIAKHEAMGNSIQYSVVLPFLVPSPRQTSQNGSNISLKNQIFTFEELTPQEHLNLLNNTTPASKNVV